MTMDMMLVVLLGYSLSGVGETPRERPVGKAQFCAHVHIETYFQPFSKSNFSILYYEGFHLHVLLSLSPPCTLMP